MGIIIVGGLGVTAYQMAASQITYEPKDTSWNVKTVKAAIDDLSDHIDGQLYDFDSITYDDEDFDISSGIVTSNKTVQVTLKKGKYLIYLLSTRSMTYDSPSNTQNDHASALGKYINIQYNNSNVKLKALTAHRTVNYASRPVSGSDYIGSLSAYDIYYANVKENNQTITASITGYDYDVHTEQLSISAIKIK